MGFIPLTAKTVRDGAGSKPCDRQMSIQTGAGQIFLAAKTRRIVIEFKGEFSA
jgi:hypothetical protein